MASEQCNARARMITGQIITGDVHDERVLSALESVDRSLFVPEIFRHVAYVDEDLSIGHGRYIMEPLIFARMLKHADIKGHEIVLDVGCGLGYSAAVLSKLAQKVVALEEEPDLADRAKTLLKPYANVEVAASKPLDQGVSWQSPYDAILIEGSIEQLPEVFADQLCEGGRLLAIENVEEAKTACSGLGKLVEYRKLHNRLYKTILTDASAPLIPAFRKHSAFAL